MLEVTHVDPAGTAARMGIRAGDAVVFINGHEIRDVIDYRFFISDDRVAVVVHRPTGNRTTITIQKDPDDLLGIEFPPLRIRRCSNRCVFCFVEQMPKGCRKSLYVRDDDYRASFLYGNYITLGNLAEDDWERIFSQRLSPLYISVHATDTVLRRTLLGNRSAPDILAAMKRLADGGIRMHAQIVLCPGMNDGVHLTKTVRDLAGLFPFVRSIAVVPVGLTSHRRGLYPLKTFTKSAARRVVDAVENLGENFQKTLGSRLVYPSDEFYIKAGRDIPAVAFYEDFAQIENGVGMTSRFLTEVRRTKFPRRIRPTLLTMVTGKSFHPILAAALKRTAQVRGLTVKLVRVKNVFFGESVTVAGLLTGKDILTSLKRRRIGDMLLVPAEAFKEDEDIMLDGMNREHLERCVGAPVLKVDSFSDIASILNEFKEEP